MLNRWFNFGLIGQLELQSLPLPEESREACQALSHLTVEVPGGVLQGSSPAILPNMVLQYLYHMLQFYDMNGFILLHDVT